MDHRPARQGAAVTKQRLAVLHAVQDSHSTADTIVQAVRERIPITVQSVYVILPT